MSSIIKFAKIILLLGLCAFIGLIVGQFISMPFLLMSRADPGVPEVSGSPAAARIADIIYPFCAAIGFFVGVYIARKRKMM